MSIVYGHDANIHCHWYSLSLRLRLSQDQRVIFSSVMHKLDIIFLRNIVFNCWTNMLFHNDHEKKGYTSYSDIPRTDFMDCQNVQCFLITSLMCNVYFKHRNICGITSWIIFQMNTTCSSRKWSITKLPGRQWHPFSKSYALSKCPFAKLNIFNTFHWCNSFQAAIV